MGSLGDNIDPTDAILSRLSEPREANELPAELRCPSGHRALRQIIELQIFTKDGESETTIVRIPWYVCPKCLTGYRYQECALIPGDEGRP